MSVSIAVSGFGHVVDASYEVGCCGRDGVVVGYHAAVAVCVDFSSSGEKAWVMVSTEKMLRLKSCWASRSEASARGVE